MDFLDWKQPADLIFLLNPFVEKEQLLAWGLPLSELKPEKILRHCREMLKSHGRLIVSCPSQSEFSAVIALAEKVGWQRLELQQWHPGKTTVQKHPRYGALLR